MWRIHSLIVWNLFALYVKTRCILNGGRLHPLLLQMAFPTHWMIIPLLLGWASEPPTNHQFLVSLQQFSRKGTARTRLIEKSPPEHRHVYSYSHYIPIISHNNHYDYIFLLIILKIHYISLYTLITYHLLSKLWNRAYDLPMNEGVNRRPATVRDPGFNNKAVLLGKLGVWDVEHICMISVWYFYVYIYKIIYIHK
jgi:hypothetical protein